MMPFYLFMQVNHDSMGKLIVNLGKLGS